MVIINHNNSHRMLSSLWWAGDNAMPFPPFFPVVLGNLHWLSFMLWPLSSVVPVLHLPGLYLLCLFSGTITKASLLLSGHYSLHSSTIPAKSHKVCTRAAPVPTTKTRRGWGSQAERQENRMVFIFLMTWLSDYWSSVKRENMLLYFIREWWPRLINISELQTNASPEADFMQFRIITEFLYWEQSVPWIEHQIALYLF